MDELFGGNSTLDGTLQIFPKILNKISHTPKWKWKRHLAIGGGGIMPGPENIEQRVVAALLGVELKADDLGMVGGAGAYVLVGGIVQKPLGVTDLGLGDTWHPLIGELGPPEAAQAELGELLARSGDVVVGALRYGGGGGGGVGGGGADSEAELVEPAHSNWGGEFVQSQGQGFVFGDGEKGFDFGEGGEWGTGYAYAYAYAHGGCFHHHHLISLYATTRKYR